MNRPVKKENPPALNEMTFMQQRKYLPIQEAKRLKNSNAQKKK